ncbi:hypothetical protein [Desulfosporosinus meridiei]|uniref:Uncharacterized protein n=1 Tax=Desulfosporosinus meridiei (strain ATCC BAA-275 / DSM 13257 / KCTC 12902 / NCIMB 13706 / S10) TaxID=768704 RepID=J7IUN6_DESMD|nr:hypothetical protein [Desulfosporosinus meridiei]AFQ43859.1 hypothetical protein Desmer_1903 [Desulfosporosinus meridiei DSM 13257]
MFDLMEHLKDLDTRIDNIKSYNAFFAIANSISKDKCPYDPYVMVFGLLTFLFYEGKLALKKIDVSSIIDFYRKLIAETMDAELSLDDARDLTYYLLEKMQNKGSGFDLKFYSLKYKSEREKKTKLIDMKLDEKADKIYYYITNEGLDFYLKTKEFIDESQVTTSLLIFRAQIRSGSFGNALETVRELKIRVHRRLDQKNELLDLLLYGQGEESEKYRKYHNEVSLLFDEEAALFNDVSELLTKVREEYLDKINKKMLTRKDEDSLTTLTKIDQEMKETVFLHKTLLNEAASLPREKERIRLMRLNSAFSVRFGFEQELEKLISQNTNPEGLKFFFEPLLMPNVKKTFNILKVFASQKVTAATEDADDEIEDLEEKPYTEKFDDVVNARVGSNFTFYVMSLLNLLAETSHFDLNDWALNLHEIQGPEAVKNADFISFIIQLNQFEKQGKERVINLNAVRLKSKSETIEEKFDNAYLESLLSQLAPRSLAEIRILPEPENDIELGYGIKVTNLLFRGVSNDYE